MNLNKQHKQSLNHPTFFYEEKWGKGNIVAGIDEVGRGPWAGPLLAAAVIVNKQNLPEGINDSKKLTLNKRERIYNDIIESSDYGIGLVTVAEIDLYGLTYATELAMQRAVAGLKSSPRLILVDGKFAPKFNVPVKTIIKGDCFSLSIAAASIIAKVTRDRVMRELAIKYSMYGWDSNVGYGTKAHRQAIDLYGICEHHRKSFEPIKKYL